MESIKVAVTVPLAAAVAAGRASYGDTTVTLTDADLARISEEGRKLLYVSAKHGGVCVAKWSPNWNDGAWQRDGERIEIDAADVDRVIDAIEKSATSHAEHVAKQEAEARAEREAQIGRACAAKEDDWLNVNYNSPHYCNDDDNHGHHEPYLKSLNEDWVGGVLVRGIRDDARVIARYQWIRDVLLPTRLAEYNNKLAEYREKCAAKERRETESKAADLTARRALVQARGTVNQLDRFDADVLPKDELIALARADWLPQIDRPIYVPMVKGDVSHDDADDLNEIAEHVQRVKFSAEECVGPWTAEQWQTIKAIEAEHRIYLDGAPEAVGMTITPMIHKAWCSMNDCDGHAERYGVRVRVERYGLRAQIEYALPSD